MSTIFIIVTALKITVSLTAAWTIIYWHVVSKGTWRLWPAGRSLMSLLTIICIGYAWRVVNRLTPDYALEDPLLGVLYIFIALSLLRIARTIRKEVAVGKVKAAHPSNTATTTPEESHHDNS